MHYAPNPSKDDGHHGKNVHGSHGRYRCHRRFHRPGLPTRKLSQPIPVYNVDGTLNEAGSIRKVIDMIMTYDRHSKRILLAVTCLGKQSMILGFNWLDKHNPEIDFRA